MHTEWTDQFSDYLDDALSPGARLALERHLHTCPSCQAVLEDLRTVVMAAPGYQGTEPSPEVWDRIAAAIEESRGVAFPVQRFRHFSLGQLVAAAATVAVLAGGGVWMAMRPGQPPAMVATTADSGAPLVVVTASQFDDSDYDAAVAELQAAFEAGRSVLDSTTLRVVEENLRVIDAAIAEARAAIDADPSNAYLGSRITLHKQRKMVLLRQAAHAAVAAS